MWKKNHFNKHRRREKKINQDNKNLTKNKTQSNKQTNKHKNAQSHKHTMLAMASTTC